MSGQGTVLVLSRHGQTVWHRENRYAGTSDIDLTATGSQQAIHLAQWARAHHPDVVVSSPVRRALETATPSAAAIGAQPVVVEGLREVHFGLAEGHTLDELADQDPAMVDRFRSDPVNNPFPGADPPAQAAERGGEALRRVAADHPGQTVLVVAHNTLLRLALCHLLDIDVSRYRTVFPRLDNGTLTELKIAPDGSASLLSFNVPLMAIAAADGSVEPPQPTVLDPRPPGRNHRRNR